MIQVAANLIRPVVEQAEQADKWSCWSEPTAGLLHSERPQVLAAASNP